MTVTYNFSEYESKLGSILEHKKMETDSAVSSVPVVEFMQIPQVHIYSTVFSDIELV